jgi:predicted nucleic acid-binding protein
LITAVDSSVLLDVFKNDPQYCAASAKALRQCIAQGALVACDIVWAEVSAGFTDKAKFEEIMNQLNIRFDPMIAATSVLSGKAWLAYRRNGGTRERIISDFLIGAHAATQCDRLLTRDRGFYRKYFKGLKVVNPAV